MLKQYSTTTVIRVVTGVAGAIQASYSYEDENIGTFQVREVGGDVIPPITVAGPSVLVPAPYTNTARRVTQIALHNAGAVDNPITVEEFDGVNSVPRWSRTMVAGEIVEYDEEKGWIVYAPEGGVELINPGPGGGGGPATDATARAAAAAVKARLDVIAPVATGSVAPGSTVSVVTTDSGVSVFTNATGAAIALPATLSTANILAAGLSEEVPAAVLKARLDALNPPASASVGAGSTVLVNSTDAGILLLKNPTAAAVALPATLSQANILAAGFTAVAGGDATLKPRLDAIAPEASTAVTVGSTVIISTTDAGVVLFKNATAASVTLPATMSKANILTAGLTEFTSSDPTLKARVDAIAPQATDIVSVGSIVSVATTDSGILLFKNATAAAITLPAILSKANITGAGLTEFTSSQGLKFVPVADNATLVAGQYSTAEPAVNVVQHFTAPAATANGWFAIANTGAGTMDVGGTQITGAGSALWVANAAGGAWVLASAPASALRTTIRPVLTAIDTMAPSELAVATALANLNLTGEIVTPFAATFAGLTAVPADASASVRYHTILTADDGTNVAGMYVSGNASTDGWLFAGALAKSVATVLDAWRASTNPDHGTQGIMSFRQVKDAIFEEYRHLTSGSWDANDAFKSLNQFVSGSSGVSASNFPNGLSSPASFVSEFYGTSASGIQRLTIFGLPTSSRGVWWRTLTAANTWSSWTLESPNYFDFTPDPATVGDTYTVGQGNVAINPGDILTLPAMAIKSSMRVTPVTTWDAVGTIILSAGAIGAGWTIVGSQPSSGNAVIDLFTDNFNRQWHIRKYKEVGRGNALPADNSSHDMFILEGHSTIPNGAFSWASAGAWVQI